MMTDHTLSAPAAAPASSPANLADLPPVYAATYDHIGVILWGEKKLEEITDRDMGWLERHPEFRIGWDHEAFTYDYLAERHPELLRKMRDGLSRFEGRLGIGTCTYGQPLSAFINDESNIRQLTMGLDAVEQRLGARVTVYMTSEHAFHAQMPQLLAGCGFRGAVLRTHFMMYGHNPEFDAPVGWWVGADGSRIPTLPTYVGQADTAPRINHTLPGNTSTLDNRILTDGATADVPLTLADFRQRFGHIRPLVATRADDVRNTEALITAHGQAGYEWVTLEAAFDLLPQPRVDFDIHPNHFKLRMPWGYCGSWIWRRARHAEVKVLVAERLAAIAFALDGASRAVEVERAWKSLLVGQHHDIHICGLEEEARLYLGQAITDSDAVIEQSMQVIGARVGVDDLRTIVFNPLSWERDDVVNTSGQQHRVRLPALGFAQISESIAATPDAFIWDAEAHRLGTPFYDVTLAKHGGIRALVDRASGHALLAPPRPSGALAGLIDGRYCESVSSASAVCVREHGATWVEEGTIGPLPYRSEWDFYAHTRRIDWRATVTFDGQWIGRPKHASDLDDKAAAEQQRVSAFDDHDYKLRLRFFPYLSPFAAGIRDYPFGIAETSDRYIQGNYWTAVSDGSVGLALLNRGLMGSVREPDGALSSVLAFALPYVWGTRMLRGEYTYELGVLPFTGDWRAADLHRAALEYNFPAVTADVTATAGALGATWSPYGERGEGAIVSALYEKGGQLYTRFYEHRGEHVEVAFDWMGAPANLREVTLREKPLGDLGGRARLGPWQILTAAKL
jgi:hypothetical protein